MSDRKLGKKPAVHDPRTYRLKAVLATALPVIPSKVNWAPSA
ncbi:hypothetical protein GGR01_003912, partial [Acetobacter oeni]|nr:hypothetical protein [Acetobacter oeni]